MKLLLILGALIVYTSCDLSTLDLVFYKLGTFKGKNIDGVRVTKNYYVPKYFKATWLHAKMTCHLYGLELAAIESLKEQEAVKLMCLADPSRFTSWAHIDGMTTVGGSKTEWFLSSGKKIPFALNWHPGGEPQFYAQRQWCLAVGNFPNHSFNYADIDCVEYHQEKFICQEIVNKTSIDLN